MNTTPLLFSRRKEIADRLGMKVTPEFNAIVRATEQAHGITFETALCEVTANQESVDEVHEDPLCDCGQSQYKAHSCSYQNGHDVYTKSAGSI